MKLPLLLSTLGLAALVGCMKHSYSTGAPPGGTVHTQQAKFYVAGLVGDNTIDLSKLCPNGVAKVQNRLEVKDYCLTACTFSLYAPLTVEVECAGGGAYLLTPDEAEGRTAVAPLASAAPMLEVAP